MANLTLVQREELKRAIAKLRQIAEELRPLVPTVAGRTRSVASDAEALLYLHERRAAAP